MVTRVREGNVDEREREYNRKEQGENGSQEQGDVMRGDEQG